jgi:hypothetical protein
MSTAEGPPRGALTVVGTGMKFKAHMTMEAVAAIKNAEKVYYNVADVMTARWIEELNRSAESLPGYDPDESRLHTYDRWVDLILGSVRKGLRTCAASYGHSGIFTYFARTAIRLAQQEGYDAVMLPGISSEACLMCDLVVDPAEGGWQSYGATDFVKRKPAFDTRSQLILWQIKVVDWPGLPDRIHREGLRRLADLLMAHYGPEHEVVIYEASRNPAIEPVILTVALKDLPEAHFRSSATLYVPRLRDTRDAQAAGNDGSRP